MSNNNTNETVQEQDLGELLQIRRDKLKSLQDEGRDPFRQTRFVRSAYSAEIKADYDALAEKTVQVAGRIMSKRGMGKAVFSDLQDGGHFLPHKGRPRPDTALYPQGRGYRAGVCGFPQVRYR